MRLKDVEPGRVVYEMHYGKYLYIARDCITGKLHPSSVLVVDLKEKTAIWASGENKVRICTAPDGTEPVLVVGKEKG